MRKLPKFREKNVVIQEIDKELLIYDLKINKAYNLNETTKIVYESCDGKTTFDDLKLKHSFSDELIFLAIDELKKADLLEKSQEMPLYFDNLTRREAVRRVGLASLFAIPVITGLVAPTAAQTASTCVGLGRTADGNLILSGGVAFCAANQAVCTSAATANSDGCCAGTAFIESSAPGVCPGSDPQNVCRCGTPPPV